MRNFGTGTRDMNSAVRLLLGRAVVTKELSFSSSATLQERWNPFFNFLKTKGIGRLERVSRELLIEYGRGLTELIALGTLSVATAQNRVSAINTIMTIATSGNWLPVSPVKDCGIQRRSFVRTTPPPSQKLINQTLEVLKAYPRKCALILLCSEFGFRSKEASLLRIKNALNEAINFRQITVELGTEGGLKRIVPVRYQSQLDALTFALNATDGDRCLIPADMSYKKWRAGQMRSTRETLQQITGCTLHDLRAFYACKRYEEITGTLAPIFKPTTKVSKLLDLEARKIISQELGHHRVSITVSYLGGQK